MYLDADNLCGWEMSQSLLTGGFKCVNVEKEEDLKKYNKDSNKGLLLEVDLGYMTHITIIL